jgi:hypothetical protein
VARRWAGLLRLNGYPQGFFTLRGGPFCTFMNLERDGADMLLPWESRSMR